jgi:hypothetical protein
MISVLSCATLTLGLFVIVHGDETLLLRVPKHQPCGKPNEAIRFADSSSSQIIEDLSRGNGCYKLSGSVKILRSFKGKINIYVESKNGTHADPTECKNSPPDNCGGIGSCVYCDACNSLQKQSRNKVQLLSNGQNLDCNKGLNVGEYKDVVLSFCAPDLDDFLKSQNIDRQAWDQVIGQHGTTVFETVYLFLDTPINTYSKSQLYEAISSGQGLIGCHKLVLNLSSKVNNDEGRLK